MWPIVKALVLLTGLKTFMSELYHKVTIQLLISVLKRIYETMALRSWKGMGGPGIEVSWRIIGNHVIEVMEGYEEQWH